MPGEAVWRRREYAVGVMFLERSRELTAAVRHATRDISGIEHVAPRILVLGKEDEVSRLIELVLRDAEYKPRILTHPRYAISTAKRIGAKAVIVNLEIDPEFSARGILRVAARGCRNLRHPHQSSARARRGCSRPIATTSPTNASACCSCRSRRKSS